MKNDTRLSGTKIGDVLAQQGRRQDWLAERLDVSSATVNRWIKGNRSIDLASARQIAELLDVPLFLVVNVPKGTEQERKSSGKEAIAS